MTLVVSSSGSSFAQDLSIGNNSSGQSNSVSFITNNYSNAIIGSGGSQNSLLISNSGTISDQSGYIGSSVSSSNNTVIVTGLLTNNIIYNPDLFGSYKFIHSPTNQSALWNNSNSLFVGFAGSGNSLVVSNITQNIQNLSTLTGYTTYFNTAGYFQIDRNNPALYIGIVSLVTDQFGYVGFNSSASKNTATVTGTNSYWSNATSLSVGYGGSSNSLLITNGGIVFDQYGYIGNSNSSSNNFAFVTGINSMWSNSANFSVGYGGSGNSLVISNTGTGG